MLVSSRSHHKYKAYFKIACLESKFLAKYAMIKFHLALPALYLQISHLLERGRHLWPYQTIVNLFFIQV